MHVAIYLSMMLPSVVCKGYATKNILLLRKSRSLTGSTNECTALIIPFHNLAGDSNWRACNRKAYKPAELNNLWLFFIKSLKNF